MKKTIALIFASIITILTLNFSSCDEGIVDPYENLEPGRRDYVWSVDTIFAPFNYLSKIWGASPSDVWAIASGGDLALTLFHYDGNEWSTDGISRPMNPNAIWGFASDDIWIGGGNAIFHYNGNQWTRIFEYNNNNISWMTIYDIWGDSQSNVWAVGFADSSDVRKGIMFNYNGSNWRRVNFGFTNADLFMIRRGMKTSNNYYLAGLILNLLGEDTIKLFEFNGNRIEEIYSAVDLKENTVSIQEIEDEIYVTKGYSIYRINKNKEFIKVTEINDANFGVQFNGRNIKDIFIRMEDGIAHYNGNNIRYLYELADESYVMGMYLFKKDVFFITNNFNIGVNYIYHGKLKK